MPLYPYCCISCGHRFEKIQSFSSEPETICPQCGGVLERLLTAPGLQFKGAGWYVNDYASKGGTSSSASASSDSNPAATNPAAEPKAAASDSPSTPAAAPAASSAKSSETKS